MDDLTQAASLDAVAIIGMAGRFPGAGDIDAFWANLRDGKESIVFFTDEELLQSGVDQTLIENPKYVKAKGILDEAEMFDATFFGYTPREAELMDPQQRIFLECAWQALEDAGFDPSACDAPVGVYAGTNFDTYLLQKIRAEGISEASRLDIRLSSEASFLATRVSYKLNLKGPGITIQTACSTSLVAVCHACQSLVTYQCDMALAGGSTVRAPRKEGYLYQESGILSPDGHCRAFDVDAGGTLLGEGVAVVVLKRLADALDDGDTIHAVIKGWALNNDGGEKVGFTAPSVNGQANAITMAHALADVSADTISYVEAHGTGTELGDPVEIAALTQAFSATTTRKGYCAIGSVKTNIGHLDAAAGIAGLIKTVLALKHRQLPPHLHFKAPNPRIDFANSPFYVNAKLADWHTGSVPRRAGVSSFGIGGTNAHVVLEEAPALPPTGPSRARQVLLFSARTPEQLETMLRNHADWLKSHPDLNFADGAYTLKVGRRRFNYACMLVCDGMYDAVEALEKQEPGRLIMQAQEPAERSVAFMFPGQGNQYVNMGLELYRSESFFRAQVDRCCELLRPELECDLREVMYPGAGDDTTAGLLKQTKFAQPALFVVEYALARLWMNWGVQPQALIGHSIGEYVAACIAGVFTLEDALKLVAARGRLMQTVAAGAMTAVPVSAERLIPMLDGGLSLAAVNESSLCVAAGSAESIERLEARLAESGVMCHRLHTSHAFHSEMMDSILAAFAEVVGRVSLSPAKTPFISNVSGTWITGQQATDPDYWVSHLRRTVRFADGIRELFKEPHRVLLEVGPGTSLGAASSRHPERKPGQAIISSMRHAREDRSDLACLLEGLGRLWLAGVNVDWPSFYAGERRRRVSLPTYPFERQRYWIEGGHAGVEAHGGARMESLLKNPDIASWFYVPTWKRHPAPATLAPETSSDGKRCWLVFKDDCAMGDRMVARLVELGHTVSVVRAGREYERHLDGTCTLAPGEYSHYQSLVNALREDGITPTGILHLWAMGTSAADDAGASAEYLDRCFYSLMHIVRAWGEVGHHSPVRFVIISDGMQAVTGEERICPDKATLLGPSTVIPQEYAHISCRSVDLARHEIEGRGGADLAEQLIAELGIESKDRVVAYRNGYRWTRDFEPVHLRAVQDAPPRLRDQGVYLITGGLGGIGLALAGYLAQTVAARLVLVGRTGLPSADQWDAWLASHPENDRTSCAIRRVREIEARGAQVMVVSADVTSRKQMQEAVDKARKQFGSIHGVIHSAGVPAGGLIQLKTRESAAAVLAPKVQGAHVLEEVFRDAELDFMVLCSSLAAVTGALGQVDYTAANAFLDAWSQRRSASGRYTVSVNWDAWSDVGMALETEVPTELAEQKRSNLDNGIRLDEGTEVFARVLACKLPQVLVSTRALSRLLMDAEPQSVSAKVMPASPARPKQGHARPRVLAQAYAAPRGELEEKIAVIWQELFGIDQIGAHDNFFELGGHSLLAIQIVSRINAEMHAELLLNGFFDAPTVALLAECLRNTEKNEGLENILDQLTDEEVERMLAEKGIKH